MISAFSNGCCRDSLGPLPQVKPVDRKLYGILSLSPTACSAIAGLLEVNPVKNVDIALLNSDNDRKHKVENGSDFPTEKQIRFKDDVAELGAQLWKIPPKKTISRGAVQKEMSNNLMFSGTTEINNGFVNNNNLFTTTMSNGEIYVSSLLPGLSDSYLNGGTGDEHEMKFRYTLTPTIQQNPWFAGNKLASINTGKNRSLEFPDDSIKREFVLKTMNEATRLNCGPYPGIPPFPAVKEMCRKHREQLPIFPYKCELVKAIQSAQASLILGASGCGKSTQVPQYILETSSLTKQPVRIICVVPHWVQAVSLSNRVAEERGENVGATVGYQVRLEGRVSPLETLLTYCTSEAMIRTLSKGDLTILKTTTHIILDELQEQEAYSELLLHCLREALVSFSHLHLVIMMTLSVNPLKLYRYFHGDMKVVSMNQNSSGISVHYLDTVMAMTKYDKDYLSWRRPTTGPGHRVYHLNNNGIKVSEDIDEECGTVDLRLVACLLRKVYKQEPISSSILVFLPQYEDLIKLKQIILNDKEYRFDQKSFKLYLLHSNTQIGDLETLLKEKTQRKIIFATDMAESCLTFNDVNIVIDTGKAYENIHDKGTSSCKLRWITKPSADERRGKVSAGKCYRLYSKECYDKMSCNQIPEILKISLNHLCLYVRSIVPSTRKTISQVFNEFLHQPEEHDVQFAINSMIDLGALDDDQNLTNLGTHLLDLAIEPTLGKALLYAVVFKCLDPIVTLAAAVSFRNSELLIPTYLENGTNDRNSFSNACSDHLAIIKCFQEWERIAQPVYKGNKPSRLENCISFGNFELIYGMRTDLLGQLRACGFVHVKGHGDIKDLNVNSHSWALVKAVLFAALSNNVVKTNLDGDLKARNWEGAVRLHGASMLLSQNYFKEHPAEWIMYDEILRDQEIDSTIFIRGCTQINAITVALFGGKMRSVMPDVFPLPKKYRETFKKEGTLPSKVTEEQSELVYMVNDWIGLISSSQMVQLILQLRIKLNALVMKQLKHPGSAFTPSEDNLVRNVLLVLTCEDHALQLDKGKGVGKWPRFAGGNLLFNNLS